MDRLTVPGTLDSLDAVSDFVARAAAEAGLDEETCYRILLAVDEIATNIISHGYARMGREGMLELWFDFDEQALTISIEDTGVTYDPKEYRRPADLDLPPDQRRVGGLGVYLAIHSVDQFHYERVGGRNRHVLVVNR